jgi:hypothetical protein
VVIGEFSDLELSEDGESMLRDGGAKARKKAESRTLEREVL